MLDSTNTYNAHRFSIAPMLHCTDRHFRYLARLLSKKSFLYTEMITTGALIHGDRERWLRLHDGENPVALQLGGSNASEMAKCAELASEYEFDEVNINVGCPSDRVQAGKFGACLMLEPDLVCKSIKAMQAVTQAEVTVKTRIGVDDQDSYEFLKSFVEKIATAGCETIIVHARKAHLSGLSPRQNRTVPPLHYEYVYKLKDEFPELAFILNGGLKDKSEIMQHLQKLEGVMVGREVYDNPFVLSDIDELIYGEKSIELSRLKILNQYMLYMQSELDKGLPLKILAQHIFGLFNGLPGARAWRRYLSENIYTKGAGLEVINEAVKSVTEFEKVAIAS